MTVRLAQALLLAAVVLIVVFGMRLVDRAQRDCIARGFTRWDIEADRCVTIKYEVK